MGPLTRDRIRFGLAIAWLVFTISLASWWLIFGLRQANELGRVEGTDLPGVHRMLVGEGIALIVSLIVGGTVLLTMIRRERARHRAIEEFFAAFTHDLRTSLASLRLQAESLQEDLDERRESNPLLGRLLDDAVRIQLQLDNSLYFANRHSGRLFIEPLSLRRTVESVAREFSDLAITLHGDATVLADARALEVVLRNLFQNARVHGGAQAIEINLRPLTASSVAVTVEDDGRGTEADANQLGRLFFRAGKTSGSGVGLYVSRRLVERMNGLLTLSNGRQGLVATLELQKVGA